MRNLLRLLALLLLLPALASAQAGISTRVASKWAEYTFAGKPATLPSGTRITITDGLTTACAAGGGTVRCDLRWTGSAYEVMSVVGGGAGTWGSITGTLTDQTDLNTALGLKAPLASPSFTGTIDSAGGIDVVGHSAMGSGAVIGNSPDSANLILKDVQT